MTGKAPLLSLRPTPVFTSSSDERKVNTLLVLQTQTPVFTSISMNRKPVGPAAIPLSLHIFRTGSTIVSCTPNLIFTSTSDEQKGTIVVLSHSLSLHRSFDN
ncbi:hypothetical protein HNY73_011208 [Argiope bruennichi]|uniref:Uncharacterized protein n=1 Tax=Argiope bruennichi TaxID=94029 RepID=A0A8T0F608_ARGBR|nr:hypothetical protein HNY73_011208 [Argiope bruennichi]